MNRDEARKILGENATEEQITNLLNNYHIQDSAKVKELENQINSLTEQTSKYSDYDQIKAKLDEINKANMTEQEKLEQMKKEAETNLKNSRIIVNNAKARQILAGYDLDDDILSMLVSDDEATTLSRANKLKAKFDLQKESVEKQTKESLASLDLKPDMTNVSQNENAEMTLDKFGNMSAEEQNKWIAENPNGLSKLK